MPQKNQTLFHVFFVSTLRQLLLFFQFLQVHVSYFHTHAEPFCYLSWSTSCLFPKSHLDYLLNFSINRGPAKFIYYTKKSYELSKLFFSFFQLAWFSVCLVQWWWELILVKSEFNMNWIMFGYTYLKVILMCKCCLYSLNQWF